LPHHPTDAHLLTSRRTLPFVSEPERPTWHAFAACRGVDPGCSSPSPTAATTSLGSTAAAVRSVRNAPGPGAPRSTASYPNRLVPPSSAGKHVRFEVNPWLPCPGRAEVCQRSGCREPATDARLRLCAGHLLVYELEAKRSLALTSSNPRTLLG
jgi:hypothetical protein